MRRELAIDEGIGQAAGQYVRSGARLARSFGSGVVGAAKRRFAQSTAGRSAARFAQKFVGKINPKRGPTTSQRKKLGAVSLVAPTAQV
jgi:hypothetical protein